MNIWNDKNHSTSSGDGTNSPTRNTMRANYDPTMPYTFGEEKPKDHTSAKPDKSNFKESEEETKDATPSVAHLNEIHL